MPIYSERSAGIYRSRYVGWREMTFDEDGGGKSVRWLWKFEDAEGKEISKFTGSDPRSSNSNAYQMMAGILGHKPLPGDDTELYVGQMYDVVYGPNQAGNLTITSVVRVMSTATDRAVAAAEAGTLAPAHITDMALEAAVPIQPVQIYEGMEANEPPELP